MVKPIRGPAKIEALFSRHGDAWRLYARGWIAPYLKQRLDQRGEAFPVSAPDARDLHEYMWKMDAPYITRQTTLGGMVIEAQGRSAVAIWEWLDGHLAAAT